MFICRHHAEWLSLVEASGSILSMPVPMEAFPTGLEAHPDHHHLLRLADEDDSTDVPCAPPIGKASLTRRIPRPK
jgi:hypothetical protein